MLSGALGGGASANAFDASALMQMKLFSATAAQNSREPLCSRAAAYVPARVTEPRMFLDPLHSLSLVRTVLVSGRLALDSR